MSLHILLGRFVETTVQCAVLANSQATSNFNITFPKPIDWATTIIQVVIPAAGYQ